jgi:hypothetical protein
MIVDIGRFTWSRSLEHVAIPDELAIIEVAEEWSWLEDWIVLSSRGIAA